MPATTPAMKTFLPLPTTDSLDPSHSQRARLLKSTRKVENILGVTPHILETDPLVLNPSTMTSTAEHKNSKDEHLYLSHPSPVSSITSFTDSLGSHELHSTRQQLSQNEIKKPHRIWKSMHLRTLFRRLRKVPSKPLLNDGTKQPSSSPSNSAGPIPNSVKAKLSTLHPPGNTVEPPPFSFASENKPVWPTTTKAPQGKIHLKRMAKLIHTLGENIPPELISSQKASQDQKSGSGPSARSHSLRTLRPSDAVSFVEPASTLAYDSSQACGQQSNAPLESTNPQASVDRKRWRRSASIGSLLSRAAATSNKSAVVQKPSSALCFSCSLTPIQLQDTSCDNQADWDGEWNVKDSQERAMALRSLRC